MEKELPELIEDKGWWLDRLGRINNAWQLDFSIPVPNAGGWRKQTFVTEHYKDLRAKVVAYIEERK